MKFYAKKKCAAITLNFFKILEFIRKLFLIILNILNYFIQVRMQLNVGKTSSKFVKLYSRCQKKSFLFKKVLRKVLLLKV